MASSRSMSSSSYVAGSSAAYLPFSLACLRSVESRVFATLRDLLALVDPHTQIGDEKRPFANFDSFASTDSDPPKL